MATSSSDFAINAPLNAVRGPTEILAFGPFKGLDYTADGGAVIVTNGAGTICLGGGSPHRQIIRRMWIRIEGIGSENLFRFFWVENDQSTEEAAGNAQWLTDEYSVSDSANCNEMLELLLANGAYDGLEAWETLGIQLGGDVDTLYNLMVYVEREIVRY